ncbi:MAG: hypothetical protein VX353_02360 [Actinomycetota bacterium]
MIPSASPLTKFVGVGVGIGVEEGIDSCDGTTVGLASGIEPEPEPEPESEPEDEEIESAEVNIGSEEFAQENPKTANAIKTSNPNHLGGSKRLWRGVWGFNCTDG